MYNRTSQTNKYNRNIDIGNRNVTNRKNNAFNNYSYQWRKQQSLLKKQLKIFIHTYHIT